MCLLAQNGNLKYYLCTMISCTYELTIPYNTVLEEDTSAPSSISVVTEKRDDHSLQVMPENAQPRTARKHSLQQPNEVASVQEPSSCVYPEAEPFLKPRPGL